MKTLILILFTVTFINFANALELKVEPVYGFERTYQHTPKPSRYKTETFVGVRGTYGTELFAGELELNHGTTSYSVGDVDTKTKTENLLIGLRLVPFHKEFYNIFLRGGIRGKRVTREISQNGSPTSSNETDGVQWDPYAGTGISLNLGGLFSLNASATLVYNRDATESERYDSRYTFGAAFKFGNKSF